MPTASQNRYDPLVDSSLATVANPEAVAQPKVAARLEDIRKAIAILDSDVRFTSVAGTARSILNDLLLLQADIKASGNQQVATHSLYAANLASNEIAKLIRDTKPPQAATVSSNFVVAPGQAPATNNTVMYAVAAVGIGVFLLAILKK